MAKSKLIGSLFFSLISSTSTASIAYASSSNFEVFNNSKTNADHGFKIEWEGIESLALANYRGEYSAGQNRPFATKQLDGGALSSATYASPNSTTGGHSCIVIDECEYFGRAPLDHPSPSRNDWPDQIGTRGTAISLIVITHPNTINQAPKAPGDLEHMSALNDMTDRAPGQPMVAAKSNGPMTFLARVPVPATVWLFGSGLAGLIGLCRHRH